MLPSFLSSGSWKQCDHQVCNLVSGRDHTATCPPSTILLSRLSKLHHLAHWLCQFLIFSGWDHTAACLLLPPGKPCVLGVWTHLWGEGGRCQGFGNISVSTIISYYILLPGLLWSQPGPDPGLERERRGRGGAAGGVARPWLGLARPRGHGAPPGAAHTLNLCLWWQGQFIRL